MSIGDIRQSLIRRRSRSHRGQALVFMLVVLVVLVFVVLWVYDLHRVLSLKSKTQNAGDSAALAAARWQGISLNLIGDLNIMHAMSLGMGDTQTASAITGLQARICFTGPIIGLMAAQQAAKNNGMYRNEGFDQLMREHAASVRYDYPVLASHGEMMFQEPWPGAWDEYADMLDLITAEGVAAGPDNVRHFGGYYGSHTLLNPRFYEAIGGRNWCWFMLDSPGLLEDYREFFPCGWEPLPRTTERDCGNSEIFGLGLYKRDTDLSTLDANGLIAMLAAERGLVVSPQFTNASGAWYCYTEAWDTWSAMAPTNRSHMPVIGDIRPEYDYGGADVVVRLEAPIESLTPGTAGNVSKTVVWTAAAKSFGYLEPATRPNEYGIVLPAFREVRLIPVDAASGYTGGGYNVAWYRHTQDHLPVYMAEGPDSKSSCWYCQQLAVWEGGGFRRGGTEWLAEYGDLCSVNTSPGGPGGGTATGH